MSNGLAKLNCAAEICCSPAEANAALRSLLTDDLGCEPDEAARLAAALADHDLVLFPGSFAREIAALVEHPGRGRAG